MLDIRIHKYVLKGQQFQEVAIPAGSFIMYAGAKSDEIALYALVNVNMERLIKVPVYVLTTGETMPEDLQNDMIGYKLFGPLQPDVGLVFHLFVKKSVVTQLGSVQVWPND